MPPRNAYEDDSAPSDISMSQTPPPNAKRAAATTDVPLDTPLDARRAQKTAEPAKRGRGRPPGSKNLATNKPTDHRRVAKPRGRPRKNPKSDDNPSAQGVTVQSPTRRGPGRPRKNLAEEFSLPTQVGSPARPGLFESPARRGPGRPRKNPDMPVSLVSDPAALPVRRGRGRPKKNPEPVQSSDADGLATPTRRKPGRPKKHVPEPEAAAMASATNSPVVSPTRRGRGRPRKSSVGATDTPLAPTPKRKGIESLSDADAAEPSRTRSPIAKRARTTEPESDQESARAVTPVRSRAAKPATDSFTIDIVSPARFAKARAAVPTLDRMRSANALGDSEETARWRRKFEDLSVLRITQAERNLSDLRKSANKQAATAETLIASLRKDNQELKHQIKNLQAKAKETEESEATQEVNEMDTVTRRALEKDVRLLNQQVESLTLDLVSRDAKIESLERHQRMTETSVDFNLRDSLRILQMVSGLTIEDVVPEDQGMSYKCLQAGPTLAIGYVLTVFDDLPNEFQYTPYEETAELDVLPDFLRETMSFAQDSASLFFWRVCDHLNQIAQLQEHSPSANDTL